MKPLFQLSVILIFSAFPFFKTNGLALRNQEVENGRETKLVKNLKDEELCAYKILKKLIENESENKEKIIFFSQVQIVKNNGLFLIETRAKTILKGFKSPSGSDVVLYSVILKNRIINQNSLPNDSVTIKSFVTYKPEYKTGRKALCSKYEWEIYNTGTKYLTGLIVDADFIIKNEQLYQYVGYVDKQYAIVKKYNLFGVIGKEGKMLLPITYDYIIKNDFGLLINEKEVFYYLNPITGKKLSNDYTKVNVSAMYNLKQKLFPVTRNNKMTLINSKFEEITPLIYDNIATKGFGVNKLLIGHRENQWFIIDSLTGKELGSYII